MKKPSNKIEIGQTHNSLKEHASSENEDNINSLKASEPNDTTKENGKEEYAIILDEAGAQLVDGKERNFYIVAIGGSAGSFEGIETILKEIPGNSGIAVIIIQHLSPDHKSILSDLLKRSTSMEVLSVEDGMQVQPNKVYVIPENKEMAILQGTLLLFQPARERGRRMPIDQFFESLAHDWGTKAICIILSGMGSDGELGARFIKESLGLVMVQDPETARYDSMPRSALKTGIADFVESPEILAKKLLAFIKYPVKDIKNNDFLTERAAANAMQKIFHLLRAKVGHDFSHYKTTAIYRRLERKMHANSIGKLEEFVTFLQENPHELDLLFKELLIGVTKFFRDNEPFKFLEENVLPLIIKNKKKNEPVRIWVAGCSTGEEAYSIAILLHETLEKLKIYHISRIQIYATDLNADAINWARAGKYFDNIAGDVSRERLDKYFDNVNENQYQIKQSVREMVIFAEHNIISDPSFINLDLITCRNLLIYFSQELQKKLMPVFHYSLNPKGILFLGNSESIGGFEDIFSVVSSRWKVYQRRENASSLMKVIDFPSQPGRATKSIRNYLPEKESKEIFYALPEMVKQIIIDRHTPPNILVNLKGDLFYIIGRTGKFLEPAPGIGKMNIFEMAREGLGFELRSGMIRAASEKTKIVLNNLKVKTNGDYQLIKVTIDPIQDPVELNGFFLVLFEELPNIGKKKIKKKNYAPTEKDQIIEELERELKANKIKLQQTIEEMEISYEELKSANEELQSTNEELQSTNEESTTAKEEMHALNEELLSVNMELRSKSEELTLLNNDMINLLNSSDIATIFLDNYLNIKRFTPSANKIINLLPSDIGRPLSLFKSNLKYDQLESDIKEVIDWLFPKKLQVETVQGKWYLMRILPYRTVDNYIDGAVVTFNEIDELKKMEVELQRALTFSENIINTIHNPMIVLDEKFYIISFNKSFQKAFKIETGEAQGKNFFNICNEAWNVPELKNLMESILPENHEFKDFFLERNFFKVGYKKLKLNAKKIIGGSEGSELILLVIDENN